MIEPPGVQCPADGPDVLAEGDSGDRVTLAAYLGGSDKFDNAVADFAESYANQNERDYDALAAAVASGRAESISGL